MSDEAKILARGAVLVDPRAAVAKLREWQLAEPVHYVLEIVRAAVMGKATRVTLENRAADLVLTFDGDAAPAEELARLLDYLFSTADRRMRLLAIAVNTALGFAPAFVDLYTTRHEGLAAGLVARVRWTARTAPNADDATLDQGAITAVARPDGMPEAGMRVHVREPFGMAVVREWFAREPAETRCLRERVIHLPIPLVRGGKPLERVALAVAVAEVELAGEKDVTGHVALVNDPRGQNELILCEHGVVLERRPLVPIGFGDAAQALPLRMLVDAPDLPTNASRSQVNLAEGFGALLRRAWTTHVDALIEAALAEPITDARRAALLALVRHACGDLWIERARQSPPADGPLEPIGEVPSAALARIFDAPLVPRATGVMTTLRALAQGEARYLWLGAEPTDPDLAPWLGGVVWARKDDLTIVALVRPLSLRSGHEAVAEAREAHARYQRFIEHPPRPPSIPRGESEVLRVHFGDGEASDADEGPLVRAPEGVRGVVVVDGRQFRQGAGVMVTSFYEGRPVSTERLLPSSITLRVALAGPGVRPKPSFDGVVRDEGLDRALTAARRAFAEGVAVLCAWRRGDLAQGDPQRRWVRDGAEGIDPEDLARLARDAWDEAVRKAPPGERPRAFVADLYERHPALRRVPLWPTSVARALATTEAVMESARKPPAVLCFATAKKGARRDGRPVLVLDRAERETLEVLVPGGVKWVNVTRSIPTRVTDDLRGLAGEEDAASLPWWSAHTERVRLIATPSRSSRGTVTYAHSGQALESRVEAAFPAAMHVVVEDDALVPDERGKSYLPGTLSREAEELIAQAGMGLFDLLLRCYEGETRAQRNVRFPFTEAGARASLRFVLASLRALRADAKHAELVARAERAPFIPVLVTDRELRPFSVDVLRKRFTEDGNLPLPTLREAPVGVDAEGFAPIIFPAKDLDTLFTEVTGIDTVLASKDLPKRREERLFRLARAGLNLRPRARLDELETDGPVGRATLTGVGSIAVAVPRAGATRRVEALSEGAVVVGDVKAREDLPVVARVELDPRRHLTAKFDDGSLAASFDGLSTDGERAVERLLEVGAQALAFELAAEAYDTREAPKDPARAFLAAWVNGRGRKRMNELGSALDELRRAPLWRTPWGTSVSIRECSAEGRSLGCVTGNWEPWLAPGAGEGRDPSWISVRSDDERRAVATLSGATVRDASDEARRVQRERRMRQNRTATVACAGAAPVAVWSARIEKEAPTLGLGELRIEDGAPGLELTVLHEFEREEHLRFDAPVRLRAVLASAAIDPAKTEASLRKLGVAPRLVTMAHALVERVYGTQWEPLPWVRRVLRWHLLTENGLGEAARNREVLRDSAGDALTLTDLAVQIARFRHVAYTSEAPEEPVKPFDEGRRVAVIAPDEVAWLTKHHAAQDYTAALRDDLAGRRWERTPPREKITVEGQLPARALRVTLDPAKHGHEGEVVVLPPDTDALRTRVDWYKGRRPLGSVEVETLWPCVVALEVPSLTPDRKRASPLEDERFRAACDAVVALIARVMDDLLAPPEESGLLAKVAAHDPRSPAVSGGRARAVGWLWLREKTDLGRLRVLSEGRAVELPAALASGAPSPVHGQLWVRRRAAGDDAAELGELVRFAWKRLLGQVVAQMKREPAEAEGDARIFLLVWSAIEGMFEGGSAGRWSRQNNLPGTSTSYALLQARAASREPLIRAPEGDPRVERPGVIPARKAHWVALLDSHDLLTNHDPEEARKNRREEAPLAPPASPAPSAREEPRLAPAPKAMQEPPPPPPPVPVPAVTAPPEPMAEWSLAEKIREALQLAGLDRGALRAVEPDLAPASRDEPFVRFVPESRVAWVKRAHPVVVALEQGDAKHAERMLAAAVLGAINRAMTAVTDADEESCLDTMLRAMGRG